MEATLTANSVYTAFIQLAESERKKFFQRVKAEFEATGTAIVAHSVTGQPLSRAQYIETINQGIAQCEAGESSTHEDFVKELESWK